MGRLKRMVVDIAATPDAQLTRLPRGHRLLLPLLSSASVVYRVALALRLRFYLLGLLPKHRLPVPVISVGNLTWGGSGKTPMVEFLARWFDEAGIAPLILTRGYAGGDEVKMLERHLSLISTRIGVGANRRETAASVFRKYGCTEFVATSFFKKSKTSDSFALKSDKQRVGIAILDDGMQHWSLLRDVELVMLNALMPWGNGHLFPRGPLREPLVAVSRADIVMIHHANMVPDAQLHMIESTTTTKSYLTRWGRLHGSYNAIHMIESEMQNINPNARVCYSRLAPSHFFEVDKEHLRLPLTVMLNRIVLCISAIGSPDAFVQAIREIGPLHVDRLDFSDHHFIQTGDIHVIKERLGELESRFSQKAIAVMTEKDYDRDPLILRTLCDAEFLVLCSSYQIMSLKTSSEKMFKLKIKQILMSKYKVGG